MACAGSVSEQISFLFDFTAAARLNFAIQCLRFLYLYFLKFAVDVRVKLLENIVLKVGCKTITDIGTE